MAVITDRCEAIKISEDFRKRSIPMIVFGTGSHWNTEAVLLAAKNFSRKHGINNIAVSMSMTFNYEHMPQCPRITYCKDSRVGFISNLNHLHVLCGEPGSPYYDVVVLPHLDHAHPEKDRWALTEGLNLLASVMFDTQSYTRQENMNLTKEYIETYGHLVMVEGIIDNLSLSGKEKSCVELDDDTYLTCAQEYVRQTGVDFLVVDLGTEQQSKDISKDKYLKKRAKMLSKALMGTGLVLHGTSSLSGEQMQGLGNDGIARVNIWTRIAREAGEYAARQIMKRMSLIEDSDFEATESRQYLYDCIENASLVMEGIFESLGYAKLKDKQ